MNPHSILSPFKAARRMACPGSRGLEAQYPQEQSVYATEGETAHWVAEQYLKNMLRPEFSVPQYAPNQEFITEDMIVGANLYVDTILSVFKYFSISPNHHLLHIEEKIEISTIHPACYGTPDCWVFLENELFIFDYKFGFGIVDVFENWQLIEYSAGILQKLDLLKSDIKVHFYIVQPRRYSKDSISKWTISVSKLISYFEQLRQSENKSFEPNAPCQPNPECNYCSAKHVCTALQRAALTRIDTVYISPMQLNSFQIGMELRYLKHAFELLEARINGLSEEALGLIKRGKQVPFFKIEEVPARDRWKVSSNEIIALGEMLGVNLAKPPEVITPKQAIKAGLDEKMVKSFLAPVNNYLKLVPADEIKPRKIFEGNKK